MNTVSAPMALASSDFTFVFASLRVELTVNANMNILALSMSHVRRHRTPSEKYDKKSK